ncbi:helix-turn-helix transcriptional regulator [Conyzicola nivalis]|uniref:helix-turn-helix transcriptional regulator n=1 Tax=Conyzicola nivalis TaxID=1477021 RepID=UPI0033974A3D
MRSEGGYVSSKPEALAEFLRARRAQLRPEDVGLPAEPGRRVRGLRRSEVSRLAHISEQYYTRLEQGRTLQPSYSVLSGLVTAFALDEYEAAYFYKLALPTPPTTEAAPITPPGDLIVQLVARRSDLPVVVTDRNQDVLLINELGSALLPALRPGINVVDMVFATPGKRRESASWRAAARQAVAALRFNADPSDPRLQQIVGGLSVRDSDFRALWADQQARPLESGLAPVLVVGFGSGDVEWQTLEIPGGYFLIAYLPTPGTFSGAVIDYLRQRRASAPTPEAAAREDITKPAPGLDVD